jgi:predicted negative regulator of RcsB-dependent stress response
MSYNLEEQDQIEQLRAFWQQWGTVISGLLLVAALAWAGWSGWHWWVNRRAGQASSLYSQLDQRIAASDLKDAAPIFGKLQSDFASTVYAQMGALALARAYVNAGQQAQALPVLGWAAAHGPVAAQRAAAMLNLAALQIDARQYEAALHTLQTPPAPAFGALFLTRRGDVYAAQGERAQARKTYEQALSELAPDAALRQLLQIKIESVGGAQ